MTMQGAKERLDWFLNYNWESLGEYSLQKLEGRFNAKQGYVMGRCFEMGRCWPKVAGVV